MQRIVSREDGASFLDAAVNPELWTALVPAAGRGTRLGVEGPKILFEVGGRSILEWLTDLLLPFCGKFVFVLSPQGAPPVEEALSRILKGRYEIAIQTEPKGMADAVACGVPNLRTTNALIVWGDQVALRPESIDFCARLHQGTLHPLATCPTLLRKAPYIHFERDAAGRLTRVLQAREGDQMPAEGESDSGLFLFQSDALRRYLSKLLASDAAIGAKTRELNFLPILPLFDEVPGQLVCARIMTEAESVGINSRSDAEFLERNRFLG